MQQNNLLKWGIIGLIIIIVIMSWFLFNKKENPQNNNNQENNQELENKQNTQNSNNNSKKSAKNTSNSEKTENNKNSTKPNADINIDNKNNIVIDNGLDLNNKNNKKENDNLIKPSLSLNSLSNSNLTSGLSITTTNNSKILTKASLDEPANFTCLPHMARPYRYSNSGSNNKDIIVDWKRSSDKYSNYCKLTPYQIINRIAYDTLTIENKANYTITLSLMSEDSTHNTKIKQNGPESIFKNWDKVKTIKPGQKIELSPNDKMLDTYNLYPGKNNESGKFSQKPIYLLAKHGNVTDTIYKFQLYSRSGKTIEFIDQGNKNPKECHPLINHTAYYKYKYMFQGYNNDRKLILIKKSCTDIKN